MSSLATVVNAFEGHAVHESASEKAANGFDMKELIGQQPERAVLDPRLLNALFVPVRDCHAPPHKVRLNPLLKNTAREGATNKRKDQPTPQYKRTKRVRIVIRMKLELSYIQNTQQERE